MTVTDMRPQDASTTSADGHAARLAIRAGTHRGPTAGLAQGFVQGNLAILPQIWRPISCAFASAIPTLPADRHLGAGRPAVPDLGEDLDIRTDLPRYRVWRHGELVAEPDDVARRLARRSGELRDRLLVFVRGSADGGGHRAATHFVWLERADVPHLDPDAEAGPFHGPLVVSMRPLKPADAIRAVQITTRFPSVHGAPVHIGKPELIGIADVAAGLWRRGAVKRRRAAGVLGLRGDAAIGDRDGEAGLLHHALSRLHAGDGPEEYGICDYVVCALCSRFEF